MKPKKETTTILACLLTLAFLVRAGVAFYWENGVCRNLDRPIVANASDNTAPHFFFGDSDSYWRLGRALAFNRPYEFDDIRHWQIFRTPGYPCILAPLFWIFGENPPIMLARLQGALFGTFNVALVVFLAHALFPIASNQLKTLPLLSGIFVAFDPTLVLQSVLVLSEESFLTFALLQNICLLDLAKKLGVVSFPSRDLRVFKLKPTYVEWQVPKRFGFSRLLLSSCYLGLTTAATIYIRPSWLYYLPFAAILLLVFRLWKGNAHEINDYYYTPYEITFSKLKLLVATLSIAVVIYASLSPWIVRNYSLTGRFIPTSLQMGASLYDGLNPDATGASDMSFVDRFREEELASPTASSNVHFEVRLDERMKQASLNWVQAEPFKAFKLALVKIYRLWSPFPREQAFNKPLLKLALIVSFLPIFLLGIYGGIQSFQEQGTAWFLLLPALYVTAIHSIFVSSIRYRTPVLYGFSILAAYALVAMLVYFRQHRRKVLRQLEEN